MADDLLPAMEAELKASRQLIRAVVVGHTTSGTDDDRLYQVWCAASARCSLAIVARRNRPTEGDHL